MTQNKITLSSINNFIGSNCTLSVSSLGTILLNSVLLNPATVLTRFSLPRSSATNVGSKITSFAFNYILTGGTINAVDITLTRYIYQDNTAVSTQNIPLSTPSPAWSTTSSSNNYRPSFDVITPVYDNQDDNTTITYSLQTSFSFNTPLLSASVTINGLEINYDTNMAEPLPASSQAVFVSKGGDDTTADGTETNPFATISAAVTAVTDSSPSKRYTLRLGPGLFSGNLSIPANFNIVGSEGTEMSGLLNLNNSSWSSAGDNRSSISNINFSNSGNHSFDFTQIPINTGTITLNNCLINGGVTTSAQSTNNTVNINNCDIVNGSLSVTGGVCMCSNVKFLSNLAVEVNSKSAITTNVSFFGGLTSGGDLKFIHTDTHSNITANVLGLSMKSGAIDARGSGTTVNTTCSAVSAIPTTVGDAVINYTNKAYGLGYDCANTDHWSGYPPITIQNAADRIANALYGTTPLFMERAANEAKKQEEDNKRKKAKQGKSGFLSYFF